MSILDMALLSIQLTVAHVGLAQDVNWKLSGATSSAKMTRIYMGVGLSCCSPNVGNLQRDPACHQSHTMRHRILATYGQSPHPPTRTPGFRMALGGSGTARAPVLRDHEHVRIGARTLRLRRWPATRATTPKSNSCCGCYAAT